MYTQRRPSSRPPRNGGYSQRGRGPSSSGRNFESNGPANFRVRGKPIQIHDKYVQLARDSAANGDKILTEGLLQHAEHYLRMQTLERDRSAPERSVERGNDPSEESDGGYRRFAPRAGGTRRRWAVSPEGPARQEAQQESQNQESQNDGYASSSEPTSVGGGSENIDQSSDAIEEQAQVEQRRPLSEGGLATNDAPDNASGDGSYGSDASYE